MSNICTCALIPIFERVPPKQMPEKDEKLPKYLFSEKKKDSNNKQENLIT